MRAVSTLRQVAGRRAPLPITPVRALARVGILIGLGIAVGLAWRGLVPQVARASDGAERVIAGEVTMAGLGLVAGVGVAVAGLVRRGPAPTVGFLLSVLGSVLGSLTSWGVGRLLQGPRIQALGVLVLWPLTLALVTAAVALIGTLVDPEPSGSDPSRRPAAEPSDRPA